MDIKELLTYITNQFKFWFIINEWESAIQLRNGKIKRTLEGGFYIKIPFLDSVYAQPIREKDIIISQINFTTKDNENITMTGVMIYKICNVEEFYNGYAEPDSIIANKISSECCKYFLSINYNEFSIKEIEKIVFLEMCKVKNKGIEFINFSVTTFSKVKTYRIIKDSLYGQISNDLKEKTY